MEKETIRLKIYGTVQGVFFRQSTREKANELSICGWVRNCEDGSVEVEAEGEETGMKEFIEWCHRGPDRAIVNSVEAESRELKNHSGFEIRR